MQMPWKRSHDEVFRIVEHPGVIAARRLTPARESRVESFRVRGIEKLDQSREPPRRGLERQRPAQRLIEIRLLTHRERPASRGPRQHPQPGFQELDVMRARS